LNADPDGIIKHNPACGNLCALLSSNSIREILNHRLLQFTTCGCALHCIRAWGDINVQSETTSRAHWYRGQAADCLALIEQAPTDPAKAMLTDMAARWLRLAEFVHKREGRDGGGRPPEAAAG
jgi:hypothetical protein